MNSTELYKVELKLSSQRYRLGKRILKKKLHKWKMLEGLILHLQVYVQRIVQNQPILGNLWLFLSFLLKSFWYFHGKLFRCRILNIYFEHLCIFKGLRHQISRLLISGDFLALWISFLFSPPPVGTIFNFFAKRLWQNTSKSCSVFSKKNLKKSSFAQIKKINNHYEEKGKSLRNSTSIFYKTVGRNENM